MTKGCIPLHAEAARLCKPSVAERGCCKIFAFLPVWEPFTARGGLPEPRTVGKAWQEDGGWSCYIADSPQKHSEMYGFLGFVCCTVAPFFVQTLISL